MSKYTKAKTLLESLVLNDLKYCIDKYETIHT